MSLVRLCLKVRVLVHVYSFICFFSSFASRRREAQCPDARRGGLGEGGLEKGARRRGEAKGTWGIALQLRESRRARAVARHVDDLQQVKFRMWARRRYRRERERGRSGGRQAGRQAPLSLKRAHGCLSVVVRVVMMTTGLGCWLRADGHPVLDRG